MTSATLVPMHADHITQREKDSPALADLGVQYNHLLQRNEYQGLPLADFPDFLMGSDATVTKEKSGAQDDDYTSDI